MDEVSWGLSRLVRGDCKNPSGVSLIEKPATGLTACVRVFSWGDKNENDSDKA